MAIHHYQRLRELIPREEQVQLLLRLGKVLSYGTTADAEAIYREALQLATLQGVGSEQAQCYFALGVLSRRRADLSGSRHALSEALRRFQIYGDLEGAEKTLEALTYAHIQEGELSAAIISATKAAEIARDTGRLANSAVPN
jgi:tetratricopeptide (TPR) repeat protein